MDESKDNTAKSDMLNSVDRQFLRVYARLALEPSALDKALKWARKTLRQHGLPDKIGWYALGSDQKFIPAPVDALTYIDDGNPHYVLQITSERTINVPWVAALPAAVELLGFKRGTPQRDAAELLELSANVAHYVQEGDAEQAASMAFHAGALWRRRQEDETARVGGDVTKGAIKGGLARSKHDLADKLLWARDDRRLEEEFGITSGRKRAEKLGRDHKVKTETFRKEVGKLRRETDPEK